MVGSPKNRDLFDDPLRKAPETRWKTPVNKSKDLRSATFYTLKSSNELTIDTR